MAAVKSAFNCLNGFNDGDPSGFCDPNSLAETITAGLHNASGGMACDGRTA